MPHRDWKKFAERFKDSSTLWGKGPVEDIQVLLEYASMKQKSSDVTIFFAFPLLALLITITN